MKVLSYTWNSNGNLLSDGINTFSYDKANRLKTFTGASLSTTFAYNGLGDRMQQTVNGIPETYLLDTAGGLTQVLEDGAHTYLYGVDRIAQQGATSTDYFLGDALGSVRQLVDTGGNVTLVKSYEPYGEVLTELGDGVTNYGYTGEWTDSTGLVNLRARYYEPGMGRFIGRDAWEGDDSKPISYNKWIYAYANPLFWTDPTGNRIYDRNKAVQYGYLHDLEKAHEPNVFTFDSDCSNFVSLSLYAGGVRDRRPDPFRGWIMSEGKPNPEYEPISYWDKWKAYKKKIKNEQYNKHFSWTNVNVLFDFLTTIVDFKSYPYTDFIPRFSQISTIIDFNTPGWLNFLSSTPIMPGDVVMYSPDGITWKHAALIVDASDSQTFYNVNDPINHPPNNRCTYPEKPRVIERSGEIIYSASGSRSIDNTSGIYLAIMIIHIPDIVPDQMNPFR